MISRTSTNFFKQYKLVTATAAAPALLVTSGRAKKKVDLYDFCRICFIRRLFNSNNFVDRACDRSGTGAEDGAERVENGLSGERAWQKG